MSLHHLKHIKRGAKLVTKLTAQLNRQIKLSKPIEVKDMLLAAFSIYFALLGLVAWEDFRSDDNAFDLKA